MDCNASKVCAWRASLAGTLIILPAVVLGILAMIADGVSAALWGQQAAALVVFALLGVLRRWARRIPDIAWVCLLVIALAATLLFPAVGGARRWLDLGLLNVNAAMLVLPALLALLGGMKRPQIAIIAAGAALCLQPDLSQLAAFALGSLPVLWQRRKDAVWSALALVLLAVFAVRCCVTPTALEPAAYSEGILAMLGNLSPLMQMAGWLAIALIPLWLAWYFCRTGAAAMLCLAAYYAVSFLFALSGAYPVPFMGFGLSPIAGWWLANLFIPDAKCK